MAGAGRKSGALAPWLLLAVLFLAFACSSLDRLIVGLLIEPIKVSLHASDTEIGMLQGFAFLLVYGVAGLPAGYLADRARRPWLVALAIAVWSLMTSLCGLATHYWSLFLARAGVGVGESALSPASYSLIADSFPQRRQGLALSIYTCGATTGAGLSLMAGGYVVAWFNARGPLELFGLGLLQPWQLTFMALGLPGLAVALLVLLLREPSRAIAGPGEVSPTVGGFTRFFARNRWTLGFHHLAAGACNVVVLASTSWTATLLIRVHGWNVARIGLTVGLATLVGGMAGLLVGGWASDLAFRRGPHVRLVFCAVAAAAGALAGFAFPMAGAPIVAVVLYGVVLMCAVAAFASANAALQFLVPGQVRGLASAVYFLSFSVVGSAGPVLVALASDRLFPFRTGIRFSLALVDCGGFAAAAVAYVLATASYRRKAGEDGAAREAAVQRG